MMDFVNFLRMTSLFMTWKIIKIFQTTNQYIFTTAMLHDFWGFIPYKNEHVFFGKIIELNWGF